MSASQFRVLLIGAGEINFGSIEGPWNHTRRLEQKLGPRLAVVGLVDPAADRAEASLATKTGDVASAYARCKIFDSVATARHGLAPEQHPHLIILGSPPFTRGSTNPGRDLELQVIRSFPSSALFVEKPVSSGPASECWSVAEHLATTGALVGVGYMLRYLKAAQMMKKILEENNVTVMGTNARYVMAYEWARKPSWWDKTSSGGPIVEQATHFCDLSRYFGGSVRLPSVQAHSVSPASPAGQLSAQRFDESVIPEENKLPRMTSACWMYESGAVGALTHVIALHGTTYDTEFEVYADGYRLKLVDPYGSPILYVRRPGLDKDEVHTFPDDDPFDTELSVFIDAIDSPTLETRGRVLSSYADAIQTYELTWAIRMAGELSSEREHIAPLGSAV